MNKKLLTLAVAAAMAAPVAAMAEAILYGQVHLSVDYVDVDANAQVYGPGSVPGTGVPGVPTTAQDLIESADGRHYLLDSTTGQDFKGWDLDSNSRASRLGVKGSEDLGNGLKAIYQIEFQVRMSDNNNNVVDNGETVSMRNSFVGLAGDWGTFLVGRHDTPLKISSAKLDLFTDTLADYNHTVGFHDLRADNAIAYISPSFSGFQISAATVASGGGSATGSSNEADGIADAWSIAAIYSNGPFYASAAYEMLGDVHWSNLNDVDLYDPRSTYYGVFSDGADDWTKWRLGLGLLDWNGFSLTGIYESHSNVRGAPTDADMELWQIQAGYAFGNSMIKGMYGASDVDACVGAVYASGLCQAATQSAEVALGLPAGSLPYLNNQDWDSWAVGFDHNFSKRTKAYVLYTEVDSDQEDAGWGGFSLGMIHKF